MKLRLPDHIQAKLGERILDLAETFPNIKWPPFKTLRVIREHEKTRAEDAHIRSRAPEGAKLSLHGVRLCEVFHLESFGQLYDGLLNLLPTLSDHPFYKERF